MCVCRARADEPGAGLYATLKPPRTCTVADILCLPDVKFVIGREVCMDFRDIRVDAPLFITPCTFEADISGPFQLAVFADVEFDMAPVA